MHISLFGAQAVVQVANLRAQRVQQPGRLASGGGRSGARRQEGQRTDKRVEGHGVEPGWQTQQWGRQQNTGNGLTKTVFLYSIRQIIKAPDPHGADTGDKGSIAQGIPMNQASRPPRFARVTKTLRPHQPGTLKLTRRYGNELLCVRYREDAQGRRRCTTVELVIDEGPVQRRLSDRSIVRVTIPWREHDIRERAKVMRARWEPETRTWLMSMRTARSLGLGDRIIPPPRDVATPGKVR